MIPEQPHADTEDQIAKDVEDQIRKEVEDEDILFWVYQEEEEEDLTIDESKI